MIRFLCGSFFQLLSATATNKYVTNTTSVNVVLIFMKEHYFTLKETFRER